MSLPGYSVLYPPLAKVAGAGGVGVASLIAATWATVRLAPPGLTRGVAHIVGSIVLLLESLIIGQVPFLLGTAFALLAVVVLVNGQPWIAVLGLSTLASLASPVVGALLLLTIPAFALGLAVRPALALLGSVAGPLVSLVVGGGSGPFPMPWKSLVSMLVFAGFIVALSPRRHRGLQALALCYALAAIVLFLVPNPIGGNLTRLGKDLALPLACRFLIAGTMLRRLGASVAVALAIVWPTGPCVTAIRNGVADPSRYANYYQAPITYLQSHLAAGARVEIPFTRDHWEAFYVARRVPLARGWERQTDYLYNQVLYQPLTPSLYQGWLADNAVAYVALPNVPIDAGGRAEVKLLSQPLPFLQPIWRDGAWTIWRVRHATPLVAGDAVLTDFDPASVTLAFPRAGRATVRVRYGALWHVVGGQACVSRSPLGWVTVEAIRAETVQLGTGLGGLLPSSGSCSRG